MGGILAAIASGGRPVEVPTIQDLQARNMQLQAMAQAGQLRQQQMAESQQNMAINAIKMQEAQYGLQDQQTMRTVLPQMAQDPKYRTSDGRLDYGKVLDDLPISPQTKFGLQKIWIENDKNHAEAQKAISESSRADQEAADKKQAARIAAADALGTDMLDFVKHGSNPALFEGALMGHAARYPNDAEMINGTLQRVRDDPTQINQFAQRAIAGMSPGGRKAWQDAEEAGTKASQARFAQGVEMVRAAAGPNGLSADDAARISKLYPELNLPAGAVGPDVIERLKEATVPAEKLPEYYQTKSGLKLSLEQVAFRNALNKVATALHKTIDWSKPITDQLESDHIAMALKMAKEDTEPSDVKEQRRTNTELAKLNVANYVKDEEYPGLAKMVVNHDMAPSQWSLLKTRQGFNPTRLVEAARALDPNFSMTRAESEFKAMEKTEADFTSGREAGLVRANSNAMEHLWMLDKARIALANKNLPALNAIANWFGTATGDDVATVFDHIAQKVGEETTKAFVPGGGGQAERMKGAEGYNHNLGDQQIASNIRADYALMDSQQRHLQEQYNKGTYGKGQQQLFDAHSVAMRDEILGTGNTPGYMKPGGAVSPMPQRLTQADVGKVYLDRSGKQRKIIAVNPSDPTQYKSQAVQ